MALREERVQLDGLAVTLDRQLQPSQALVDGRPVTACRTLASRVEGTEVLTIEGLGAGGRLHPVQQAFLDAGAMQCGYCVPGMIMTTVGFLNEHPESSPDDIVRAMNGNLCRCCGYLRILEGAGR